MKFLLRLMSKLFRSGLFQNIRVPSLAERVAFLRHPISLWLFNCRVPDLIFKQVIRLAIVWPHVGFGLFIVCCSCSGICFDKSTQSPGPLCLWQCFLNKEVCIVQLHSTYWQQFAAFDTLLFLKRSNFVEIWTSCSTSKLFHKDKEKCKNTQRQKINDKWQRQKRRRQAKQQDKKIHNTTEEITNIYPLLPAHYQLFYARPYV